MSSDAAALPSPPDFAPGTNGTRPRSLGFMYSSGRHYSSRPGAYQNGNNHGSPDGGRPPRFPNIKDLQDQAAALDVNESTSVGSPSPMMYCCGDDS